MTTVSKKTALSSLRKLLERSSTGIEDFEYSGWSHGAKTVIERVFGEDSKQLSAFLRQGTLPERRSIIESFIAEVEDFWEDDEPILKEPPDAPAADDKNVAAEPAAKKPCVFIGHGQSPVWARLQIFLENDLGLDTVSYEAESRAGEAIIPILEEMLERATFAVLVLTAEDATASGTKRARQNVIHEAGLFQGKLGFRKAILLLQEGTEDFSNVAGLQHIPFEGDKVDQVFWQLRQVLSREGQLAK